MFKYTVQFKSKVVRHYLEGKLGYKLLAAHYGIAAPMIRRWVESYREHGADGLRRKVGCYDQFFKLSVLQHMWDNALSYNQTAAVFNIRNPTSIGIWSNRYREGGIEALARQRRKSDAMKEAKPPTTEKPDDELTREELLEKVEYLRMEVVVLKKLEALVQAKKTSVKSKRK